MKSAYIKAVDYYLPEKILNNASINEMHPEWSIEKIALKTGIYERHIADENECSSDMAVKAAETLFNSKNIDRESIDYLIFCTQSPDYFLPTTACILQHRLKLSKQIGALDFNLGCSGFIYGLGLAKGLIATGQANNVLLLTAETYSKFIHPNDKSNKTIFGDGASATLISCEKNENINGEILGFNYGTDGSGSGYLIVRNNGMRSRHVMKNETQKNDDDYLFMDGEAIFNFTAFNVPPLIHENLKKNNFTLEEIDLFIFHQANEYMLQTLRKRAKIPNNKFYICLKNCANTVSSTIPIALKHAIDEGNIHTGNKVLLCGFGVGLSMGAVTIQF